MNTRTRLSPAACWRQRFLALARQVEGSEPRPATAAGLRVRGPRGLLAARRPGSAFARP